jgi:hypothetical protein
MGDRSTPTPAHGDAETAAVTRYRCSSCGNLTRFDVVTVRKTRAFHHFSVGGDLEIEDETVLDERIEEIACRWCGATGAQIEVLTDESVGAGEEAAS